MRHHFRRTITLFVVCAFSSITALAMTTTRQVTFIRTVTVNGTPVKAGTYKATFDDKTGEFTILNGKKIVAKSSARLETVADATKGGYSTKTNGESSNLVSMDMNGTTRAVIIDDSDGKASLAPLPILAPLPLLLLVPLPLTP